MIETEELRVGVPGAVLLNEVVIDGGYQSFVVVQDLGGVHVDQVPDLLAAKLRVHSNESEFFVDGVIVSGLAKSEIGLEIGRTVALLAAGVVLTRVVIVGLLVGLVPATVLKNHRLNSNKINY